MSIDILELLLVIENNFINGSHCILRKQYNTFFNVSITLKGRLSTSVHN